MKFSFVKANATKILLLPLYVLVGLLARTVPRNQKLWVFGRKSGFGEGPLRVLEEARRIHPDFRFVWMAQNEKDRTDAKKAGIECVPRASITGFLVTLRASVIVITHGLGDVNRPAAPGAKIIQLWHGTPLKLISLDSPSTYSFGKGLWAQLMGRLMLVPYRAAFRAPTAYVAASELSAKRFMRAFGISREKILVIGDPRCDCLRSSVPRTAKESARAVLAEIWGVQSLPERMYMYAPTWRDGEADPGVPNPQQLERLAEMCTNSDAWLIIRSHPWGHGADQLLGSDLVPRCIQFLPSSVVSDATPLLHAVDGLISDYSAIAIDYALLERPIYFFAPDLVSYASTRGLYESYETYTGGDWSVDWDGVARQIESDVLDPVCHAKRCKRSRTIKVRHHAYDDGGAVGRLLAFVARKHRQRVT